MVRSLHEKPWWGGFKAEILESLEDFKQRSNMGIKRPVEGKGPAWGLFEPNRP